MKKYPHLEQLLGTRFHEDWTLDYESSAAAVNDFVTNEPKRSVELAVSEIDELLKDSAGNVSSDDIRRLGGAVDPTGEGLSPTEWLSAIKQSMIDSLTRNAQR